MEVNRDLLIKYLTNNGDFLSVRLVDMSYNYVKAFNYVKVVLLCSYNSDTTQIHFEEAGIQITKHIRMDDISEFIVKQRKSKWNTIGKY